jgi:deazaflavin-dependent oxidoreductase (nitroreductase family)
MAMSMKESIADMGAKAMNAGHRAILRLSRGRVLSQAFGMPTLELHVTGRKSGQRRSVMLTSPVHDSERIVLVASKGGDDRDPEWYRNLVADPQVEITLGGVTKPYIAQTATAEQKSVLWPEIVKAYRGYGSYQRRTVRDIPVVICTPSEH